MPFTLAGEFRDVSMEAGYRNARLPESRRAFKLAMLWAFGLNLLFVASDLRFWGQPHLVAALAARGTILAASLAGFALCRPQSSVRRLEVLTMAWAAPVIAASAVLVSPGSAPALLILFVLPVIFYLAFPVSLSLRAASAALCSAAVLAGYLSGAPNHFAAPALIFGIVALNAVLALSAVGSGRLSRQAFAALGEARAAGAELARHRRTLLTVLQAVPVPLLVLAPDTGRLIEANSAAREYFGQSRLAALADARELFAPADRPRLGRSGPADGPARRFAARLPWPDGGARDALAAVSLLDVEGEAACLVAVVDVAEVRPPARRGDGDGRAATASRTWPLPGTAAPGESQGGP
jgi:PAS domain-containing protein